MKKYMLLAVALLVGAMSFAQAQADEKYVNKLNEMFEVSGSIASYEPVMDQMFKMFEMQSSEEDKQKVAEIKKEMKSSFTGELTKMLAPIYVKYLTLEDLDAMIKFYKSPVGKKYASATPQIASESVAVGQQWGMKLAKDIQAKLAAE